MKGVERREVLFEQDCPALDLGRVAVLGFGNQGRAHALNLRDAGADVAVALRAGSPSAEVARGERLHVCSPGEAVGADVLVWAIPDEAVPDAASSFKKIKDGQLWLFLHGLAVTWGWVVPPGNADVALLAPQGPGAALRGLFLAGKGLPGALAVERDSTGTAEERLLAYARAVGCARGGLLWTTFREETVVDHFGEQAVLCGGVPTLVRAAWDTLVGAGHDPRLAYIECMMQLKLLADLMYERGTAGMRGAISGTALFGAATGGDDVIGAETKKRLRALLEKIESGAFADRWLAESGKPDWPRERERILGGADPFEEAGRWVRENLRWPGLGGENR
ncbi:MAG TPA: ketol-acid reductoisomerase [bacterium]|nr:ketol-acid reductoisomerase [bacterium]